MSFCTEKPASLGRDVGRFPETASRQHQHIHPEPRLWTAPPRRRSLGSRSLFSITPSIPWLRLAIWALHVSCDVMSDILAAEPAGRNNIGVCGLGGYRKIRGRDGWQGARAGRDLGCRGVLSLPTRSPFISRPRIEPPVNTSTSYLNTLLPSTG